ncbi:MMPL family transporter [Nocardia rhizosphaerae]|uniref:MMPL family transporter n=1 Tax=Nocardia rhizosphaerae TaxID=1691571 RepID=A0ABV8KZ02_9NOCA
MFTRWGDLVYRFRFAVIVVVGGALLALGAYGTGLNERLTQSGWFDPGSESVQGAEIADAAFGRDHNADVIVVYNAPEGKTIDDPEFQQKIVDNLNSVVAEYPDQVDKINGTYWRVGDAPAVPSAFGSKDKKHAFASIAIVGDDDTTVMANYRVVADAFYIPGVDVEVSGLQPLGVTLNDTIAHDTKRMEVLALPAVAVLLFFIFGGIVAAGLPLIIGGLTIVGATGIVMTLTNFTEVNSFVTGVVSMIGLGLAIDYGLFIVSRFREEMAEGYDTPAAIRRTVVTSGRTVVFSATMIIASLGGVLLFPQGFLRSVAYGTIATVSLAALTAVTILPAMLGVLGPRVDMLGLKRFRKDKTAEQIENGFWGKLTRWVMRHPLKVAIPVTVGLLLLIIPVKNLAFGGINEKYLPPDNPTRVALEHFYEIFPQKKTDPIQLVFVVENGDKADTDAIGLVWKQANQAPGLVEPFAVPSNPPDDRTVYRTSATLIDPTGDAEPTIDYLRAIDVPDSVTMYVTGQPVLMADSIDTLLELMPWMILIVLFSTFVLMFLTFGSLVLPIKAALMSALGLGSTLGILTWIFIDGNGAELLNFTPQPISAPVLMLIIAIIYGLSTDYEVFLVSRMVEARAQGASTTEAVRIGTAQTGRIITAAALILLVVTGAFAFSDMVMMQYIAYGMIAALFIDATVLRMLLVPAIMKLLGDDCWWAPKWMKRIQEKIGLGEPILDDERPQKGAVVDLVKTTPITDPPTMQLASVPDSKLAKTPRRPRTVAEIEAEAPTQRMDKIVEAAEPARPRAQMSPDPTRPRAPMLSGELPRRSGGDTTAGPVEAAQPGGEPTQVLPIVKPDTQLPDSVPGQTDSASASGGSAHRDSPIPEPGRTADAPGTPESQAGSRDSGVAGGADSTATDTPGGLGGGFDAAPPRGAARVQPPAGYTPPAVDLPVTPRVSTPEDAPGTPPVDSARPSIVNPTRPNVQTPPSGIVPPPAPSIVTPPPGLVPPVPRNPAPRPPSIVTPIPRSVEPPAGGTFSGFTPVTDSGHETTEGSAPESDSRGIVPQAADPAPRPTAHGDQNHPAAEEPAGRPARDAAAEESSARSVFGTPVPVEPLPSTPPWPAPTAPNGFRAPDSDSAQVGSPTGFVGDASTDGTASGFDGPATAHTFGTITPTTADELGTGDDAAAHGNDSAAVDRFTAAAAGHGDHSSAHRLDDAAVPGADENDGAARNGVHTPGLRHAEPSAPVDGLIAPGAIGEGTAPEPSRGFRTPEAEGHDRFSAGDQGVVRPQVAPPGFTAVPTGPSEAETAEMPREPRAQQGDGTPDGAAGQWQAPAGFTAVPAPSAQPPAARDDSAAATPESEDSNDSRNEIENWMAQLRSSRRGTTAADEGRHHGGDGRTVSVNELLRRREDDAE